MNQKKAKRVRRLLKKAMREPSDLVRQQYQAEFSALPEKVQRRAVAVVMRRYPTPPAPEGEVAA